MTPTIHNQEWEKMEMDAELSEELKSSIDIISRLNIGVINDSPLLDDMIAENTMKECVEDYSTLKMLAERYVELISACQKLQKDVCKEIGCELEFGNVDSYYLAPVELYEKYNEYTWILLGEYGEKNYRFAERICEMLPYHKKAAEEYIERQKQERRAKKEAEALLTSIDEDDPSTSNTPKDTDPTDVKKQTIIARGTALYMLIRILQKAGIMPGDNEIDGTVIGRFIATIIGEDLSKDIRNTTTYRKVINKLDKVSDKAKTEAEEYLKPLKIKDD